MPGPPITSSFCSRLVVLFTLENRCGMRRSKGHWLTRQWTRIGKVGVLMWTMCRQSECAASSKRPWLWHEWSPTGRTDCTERCPIPGTGSAANLWPLSRPAVSIRYFDQEAAPKVKPRRTHGSRPVCGPSECSTSGLH